MFVLLVRRLQGLGGGYGTPGLFCEVVLAGVRGFEGGVGVHGGEGGGEGGGVCAYAWVLEGAGGRVDGGDGVVTRYAGDGCVFWFWGGFGGGGGAAAAGARVGGEGDDCVVGGHGCWVWV